jgi:hypothetical protein
MFTALKASRIGFLKTNRAFSTTPVEKPTPKPTVEKPKIEHPAQSIQLADFLKCEIKVARVVTAG